MGKARVSGNNCQLFIHSKFLALPIPLGEIDNFSAKSLTTVIKKRPIGFIKSSSTLKYDGWDLSFSGGKVDWSLAHYYFVQDVKLMRGENVPTFAITRSIEHFGGEIEQYVYEDVVLFGLEESIEQDDAKDTIQGFASSRRRGILDTTYASTNPSNIIRQLMMNLNIGTDLTPGALDQ